MRIPTKVVCLWSCLTAFTFIHTAGAQDYSDQSGAGYGGGVASAEYGSSMRLPDDGQGPNGVAAAFAPLSYQGPPQEYFQSPPTQGYYPPPMGPGPAYPPPMVPPNANYYPQLSPFEQPVMDRTYRQNGIWVNDSIYDSRSYGFSLEYMRVKFNRPGTDTIGDPRIGVPDAFDGVQTVSTGVFGNGEDLESDGIRGKFIINNADSSMMELSAFYVGESESNFHPFEEADLTNFSTLFPRGLIGLNDGTDEGVALPFDSDFKLAYKQQAFGADLTWTTMPLYDTTGFRMRPTFGAKYLAVRELFQMHGENSNLTFAFVPGGGAIPGSVGPNPFGNPAYESDLTSRTKSYLAGPELGLRYEVGGKNFLLYGQSRLAIAVNHETVDLFGNNIGDGFEAGFPQPTLDNPNPAAFRDKRTTTHVSPIYTQDFYFKGKVFKHLPIINDLPLFANADMLVGYNFILVGNMVRPTKVIDWRVDNPKIDLSHSRWYMQAVTFGLQWEY